MQCSEQVVTAVAMKRNWRVICVELKQHKALESTDLAGQRSYYLWAQAIKNSVLLYSNCGETALSKEKQQCCSVTTCPTAPVGHGDAERLSGDMAEGGFLCSDPQALGSSISLSPSGRCSERFAAKKKKITSCLFWELLITVSLLSRICKRCKGHQAI